MDQQILELVPFGFACLNLAVPIFIDQVEIQCLNREVKVQASVHCNLIKNRFPVLHCEFQKREKIDPALHDSSSRDKTRRIHFDFLCVSVF